MTLWRIRATVDDRPGFLAVLTASLALREVNILSVQVHTTESGAVDDFLVDAPEGLTAADLVEAVVRGRGRDAWVGPADARGLVDEPTRVLTVAARVAGDVNGLADGLASLLGDDCEVSWRPEELPGRDGYNGAAMRVRDPAGGTLHISRHAPAFTPAEYARAHALIGLARVVFPAPAKD
jgi:hypothetical protein